MLTYWFNKHKVGPLQYWRDRMRYKLRLVCADVSINSFKKIFDLMSNTFYIHCIRA